MYFDLVEFGKRLTELRKETKTSQEELAEEIGVSLDHLKHLEIGERGCSIDLLLVLAERFNVSTDYLLTGKTVELRQEHDQLKGVIDTLTTILQSI